MVEIDKPDKPELWDAYQWTAVVARVIGSATFMRGPQRGLVIVSTPETTLLCAVDDDHPRDVISFLWKRSREAE